jgi:hypothetical protein
MERKSMKIKAAAMFAFLVLALSAFAADISGKWQASTQGPDGEAMDLIFNFKAEGDALTGTVTGPMGEMEISEGKVEGDTIAFTVAMDDFKIAHTGKLEGDVLKIKVDMGDQSFEMTAKKI